MPPGLRPPKTSAHRQRGNPSASWPELYSSSKIDCPAASVNICGVRLKETYNEIVKDGESQREPTMKHKCPICKTDTDSASHADFPFCSEALPTEPGQRAAIMCGVATVLQLGRHQVEGEGVHRLPLDNDRTPE